MWVVYKKGGSVRPIGTTSMSVRAAAISTVCVSKVVTKLVTVCLRRGHGGRLWLDRVGRRKDAQNGSEAESSPPPSPQRVPQHGRCLPRPRPAKSGDDGQCVRRARSNANSMSRAL